MKKVLLSLLFIFLLVSNSFAVVELDGDSNEAVDISKGGTNEGTIAEVKSAFEIEAPNKSFIINGAIASDDFLLWLTPVAITITDIKGVLQSGTNVIGGLDEVDPFVSVSGITKANPGVVTATAHGYSNGDTVYFSRLTEMTELNGTTQTVANKADNTFEIIDTSGYGAAETTGGDCAQRTTPVDADITFDGGLDEDDGALANGTIDAGDWVKWHTTSISSPGFLTVTIYYTID